jgi:hypothetical protein
MVASRCIILRGRSGSLGNSKEQEIEVKNTCLCDMLRVFARPIKEEKKLSAFFTASYS